MRAKPFVVSPVTCVERLLNLVAVVSAGVGGDVAWHGVASSSSIEGCSNEWLRENTPAPLLLPIYGHCSEQAPTWPVPAHLVVARPSSLLLDAPGTQARLASFPVALFPQNCGAATQLVVAGAGDGA